MSRTRWIRTSIYPHIELGQYRRVDDNGYPDYSTRADTAGVVKGTCNIFMYLVVDISPIKDSTLSVDFPIQFKIASLTINWRLEESFWKIKPQRREIKIIFFALNLASGQNCINFSLMVLLGIIVHIYTHKQLYQVYIC